MGVGCVYLCREPEWHHNLQSVTEVDTQELEKKGELATHVQLCGVVIKPRLHFCM